MVPGVHVDLSDEFNPNMFRSLDNELMNAGKYI